MKTTTFILLVLGPIFCGAQNITLTGTVTDSLSAPMELANVLALVKADSSIAAFTTTDEKGKFKLKLQENTAYIVKASFIGYHTFETTIGPSALQPLTIVLRSKAKTLDAVEVVYEFPVVVSGDTISYKADAFAQGNERKLEHILSNLPGFEIDENGEVKVQGKKVDQVLVEGKKFFDGDSKLATQNIPASAVDKVQLLRNFNDVNPLKGLGAEDNIALNITLKEGSKRMLFGDVEVGAGNRGRLLGHSNLFYYAPKTSINAIGDYNNIGKQSFTFQDYMRFGGGLKNRSGSGMQMLDLSEDPMGMAMMQYNQAKEAESGFGALNISHNPNKKWSISGYGIVSNARFNLQTKSARQYVGNESSPQELSNSDVEQNTLSTLAKVSASYIPNALTHLEMESFFKSSIVEEKDRRTSNFGNGNIDLNESRNNDPLSFNQTFSFYKLWSEKNVFALESSWKYNRRYPKYLLESEDRPFDGVLPLETAEDYIVTQNEKITSNTIEVKLDDYWVLSKTQQLGFNAGLTYTGQDFESSIGQQFANQENRPIQDPIFSPKGEFTYLEYYFGTQYKVKLGDLTLNPGLQWHNYQVKSLDQSNKTEETPSILTPTLNAKYKFSGSHSISFSYRIQAEFADYTDRFNGLAIQNYNTLKTGNTTLSNSIFHDFNLSYFNFNLYNQLNLYLFANYKLLYDGFAESVVYNNNDRITAKVNSPSNNEQAYLNFSIEKKIVKTKIKFTSELQYANQFNSVDLNANNNTNIAQNYAISTETTLFQRFILDAGFKKNWNHYSDSQNTQVFVNNVPFASLEFGFLKHLTLAASYEYNDYHNANNTTKSEYEFLEATLYFQKDKSPWEFKLSGKNLLETSSIRRDAFDGNIMQTYAYFVQPQYFMLSVQYNL